MGERGGLVGGQGYLGRVRDEAWTGDAEEAADLGFGTLNDDAKLGEHVGDGCRFSSG